MAVLPPPNLLGAPQRYDKWRSFQAEAVLAAAESTKRFIVPNAPTGFGKSLMVVSHGLLTASRTVILTATKALGAQYYGDFHESGLIEIRGLNSYECVEGGPTGRFGGVRREGYRADRGLPMMCDEAPCQVGAFCPKRDGGCHYYDAYRHSTQVNSRLIVTNYAYFMSIHRYGEGLGPIDLLVLDEAHKTADELGGFVGTELRDGEVDAVMPGEPPMPKLSASQITWVNWAGGLKVKVTMALETIRAAIKESERTETGKRSGERMSYSMLRRARDLKRLLRKLEAIASMKGDWVVDQVEDSQRRPVMKFDPVWPGAYAEDTLFLGIKKIVMVSATVTRKTPELLGVSPADVDYREYPSTFPKANRPIIYIPTAHMNKNAAASGMGAIMMRCNQIIERRLDRKAIIQTVSYKRAREIYLGSNFKEMMMIHDESNTREVIERFRRATSPVILVSPVLDTGYDFPYEMAEYQIIVKVPFPVTVDKIVKARADRDPGYKDHVTMIKLVQMAGRICRAEDDRGETIIIDSDFGWWYSKIGSRISPRWFTESVRFEQMLGIPLPKLERRVA